MSDKIKMIELFSGIGAQAQAMKEVGLDFETLCCEIDPKTYKSYCAIHGDTPNIGDITKVEHLPPCNLLFYSFPCTDISMAGKREGFTEGSGTRSSLLWEVKRLLLDMKERADCGLPMTLIMENVKALVFKKNLPEFNRWIEFLDGLGYTSVWKVMNAKDYGVPQNRERVFLVSRLDGKKFKFPESCPDGRVLRDVLEKDVPENYYLSAEKIAHYEQHRIRQEENGRGFGWKPTRGDKVGKAVTTNADRFVGNFVIEDAEPIKAGKIEVAGSLNIENWHRLANEVLSPDGIDTAVHAQGNNLKKKVEIAGDLNRPEYQDRMNRVYDTDGLAPTMVCTSGGGMQPKIQVVGDLHIPGESETNNRVHSTNGLCPTVQAQHKKIIEDKQEKLPMVEDGDVASVITPGRMSKSQNGTRYKTDGSSHTVTASDNNGILYTDNGTIRIRYLTPRECWRLQGFPDEAFDAAVAAGMTKTALYSQAGNSIAVPCLKAIFKGLYIDKTFEEKKTVEDWCK